MKNEDSKLQVCRLCLCLVEDDDFHIFDDIKKEMLTLLLLDLDIRISKDPVMCISCTENLQKAYDFKTEFISYFHSRQINQEVQGYQIQCTLCCQIREEISNIEENILLKEILEKCVPEVEIEENISVCNMCLELLQSQFNFIMRCLDVEEKLSAYFAKTGFNKDVQISLFSIIQSEKTEKDNTDSNIELFIKKEHADNYETNSSEDNKIQCMNEGIESHLFIKEEYVEIKTDIGEEQKKIHKCDFCHFQSDNRNDMSRHVLTHKEQDEVLMYKCSKCAYQTKRKGDLNLHLATHRDLVEVYKCHLCHYKTITKCRLKEHVLKHKLPKKYKCDYCSFQAMYKKILVKHLRSHKTHRCQLCPYETGAKNDLIDKHMPLHEAAGEVLTYNCSYCNFKAKRKNSLNRHILRHKNPEEITMYQCTQCMFQTKQRRYLTTHLLSHKNPEEIIMFKCDLCSYESRHKSYLKRHVMIHKIPNESKILNCTLCSYGTNKRSYYQKHMRMHK